MKQLTRFLHLEVPIWLEVSLRVAKTSSFSACLALWGLGIDQQVGADVSANAVKSVILFTDGLANEGQICTLPAVVHTLDAV